MVIMYDFQVVWNADAEWRHIVLSCIVLSHIWQFCEVKVGILGTQSPKYVREKGLQTGPFKSS